MIKFATFLIVGATAISVRDEDGDAAWDDSVYQSGLAAGRAAAAEYIADHPGLGEDYRYGYADGLLEALVPESSEYHGDDFKDGDPEPEIELPEGWTLPQAHEYCKTNLEQEGCKDLINYCKVKGCKE